MKIISFAVALSSLFLLLPSVVAKESAIRGSAPVRGSEPTQRRTKAKSRSKKSKSSSSSKISKSGNTNRVQASATGDQEVSPVTSATTAEVFLSFDDGFTEADFSLVIEDGVGVTQVHLHCAPAGQNGPFFTFLVPLDMAGQDFDGLAAQGTITNADIMPVACTGSDLMINNVASVYAAIRQDLVYVNVHTLANMMGEVRGQLFIN